MKVLMTLECGAVVDMAQFLDEDDIPCAGIECGGVKLENLDDIEVEIASMNEEELYSAISSL